MTRNCPTETGTPSFTAYFFSGKTELLPDLTAHTALPAINAATFLAAINLVDLEKLLAAEQGEPPVLNLLSAEEKKLLAGFTYPKRRREWIGGRLAAKICVRMLNNPPSVDKGFTDLSILPSPHGSPVLSGASITSSRQAPTLSISHSHHYAVAMAAGADSCGIDIQMITDRTMRVVDRFAEPDEQQLLRDALPEIHESVRLTLLWSAKEALKKSLLADQPVIFQGVTLLSVKRNHHISLRFRYPGALSNRADITAVILENYVLAYTVSKPHHAGTPRS